MRSIVTTALFAMLLGSCSNESKTRDLLKDLVPEDKVFNIQLDFTRNADYPVLEAKRSVMRTYDGRYQGDPADVQHYVNEGRDAVLFYFILKSYEIYDFSVSEEDEDVAEVKFSAHYWAADFLFDKDEVADIMSGKATASGTRYHSERSRYASDLYLFRGDTLTCKLRKYGKGWQIEDTASVINQMLNPPNSYLASIGYRTLRS